MATKKSPGIANRRVSNKKSSGTPLKKVHEDTSIFDFREDNVGSSNTDRFMNPTVILGAENNQSKLEVMSVDNFPTQQQDTLLCFPFLAGEKIELAGKGLHLCDSLSSYVTDELRTVQLQKTVGRKDIVTISKMDRMTLNPSTYVNDNVIDFWMAWLCRNLSDEVSSIIIFTSHFYSTLANPQFGLDHVSRWIDRRSIDLFSKAILLFPICLEQHWSLLAALLPGQVSNQVNSFASPGSSCIPVMLHLDSLNFHDGNKLSNDIRLFLDYEWSKKKGNSIGNIFTTNAYPLLSPSGMFFHFQFCFLYFLFLLLIIVFLIHLSVPQQKNGFDCGLYVCRYAYGIFKLREQVTSITNLIMTSEHFRFNQQVINQFRTQLGKLLDRLSNVYLHGTLVNKKQHKLDKIEVHSPRKGVKRKRISSPRKATKRKQILNTSSKSDYVTFITDKQPKHDDISILTDDLLRPVFTKTEKQSTDIEVQTQVKEVHSTASINQKKQLSNVNKVLMDDLLRPVFIKTEKQSTDIEAPNTGSMPMYDDGTEMQSKAANTLIQIGNVNVTKAEKASSNVNYGLRTPRRTFAATVKQLFSPMWSPFMAKQVQDQVITKSDHLVLNEQKSLVDVEETAELAPFISSEQVDQPQRLVVFDDTAEQTQLLEAHDVAASEQMTLLDAHDIAANEIMCAEMHETTAVLKSIEVPARPSFLETDEVSKDMPSLAAQASLLDTAKVSEQMPLSASLDDNDKVQVTSWCDIDVVEDTLVNTNVDSFIDYDKKPLPRIKKMSKSLGVEKKPQASTARKNSILGLVKTKLRSKHAGVTKMTAKKATNNIITGIPDDDPFVGKLVAFWLGGTTGKQLMVQLGYKLTFDAVCFELNDEAGHLLGTVMRVMKVNKGSSYTVVWEYSALGETVLPLSAILEGHKEAELLTKKRLGASRASPHKPLRVRRSSKFNTDVVKEQLQCMSDDESLGEAPTSDDSMSSEDDDAAKYDSNDDWEIVEETKQSWLPEDIGKSPIRGTKDEAINGLTWVFNGEINNLSPRMMEAKTTTIKKGMESNFKSPLSSMMSVFPLFFWDIIVQEINRYAAQTVKMRLETGHTRRPKLICGYKWQDVTRQEIMTYFGILIYCMLYPQTGRRIRDYWDSPYHNAWTKFMTRGRYLQITCALHFNDNNDEEGRARDSLHKIRPLLNTIKKTLGKYATFGNEISYDEATMANKSSYGRHLICFNPMKPTGKFHFKIYMICCAKSNLTLRMKIHTRDNSDMDSEDNFNEFLNKLDNQTIQLCKPLFNSGCTVNMDNYYMSTTCAMKLRQNGVFCRGTIRSNRKFVPKSILFTPAESRTLPRGTHRIAVNHDNNMMAIGWLDNKPVHFVSTADTTDIVTVNRKSGATQIAVSAPMAVANYNKFMGGVDRHDRLRSTFSLCKRHKFKKYYVKLLLFIMDIGLTNAWVYYKMCHEDTCSKERARADFFQTIAECMVNTETNWQEYEQSTSALSNHFLDLETPEQEEDEWQITCLPVHLNSLPAKLSTKIKICQVCKYELRKPKWKSVTLCPRHGVRLCTEVRQERRKSLPIITKTDGSIVTDWSWTCDTTDSCWNKFHKFYQPQGLFNTRFTFTSTDRVKFASYVYTSPLYQKKYCALGIEVTLKSGKTAGMGRFDERLHITMDPMDTNMKSSDLHYLQQDSDDENE
jgi:hypothetical protein